MRESIRRSEIPGLQPRRRGKAPRRRKKRRTGKSPPMKHANFHGGGWANKTSRGVLKRSRKPPPPPSAPGRIGKRPGRLLANSSRSASLAAWLRAPATSQRREMLPEIRRIDFPRANVNVARRGRFSPGCDDRDVLLLKRTPFVFFQDWPVGV